MSSGTNLVVPVVLWGKHPPTHCVSCVYLSRDQCTLITGCYDGQICLWQVDPDTLKVSGILKLVFLLLFAIIFCMFLIDALE